MTRRAIPDAEEREALDCLVRYMEIVWNRWELRANADEQSTAIHVLQAAVVQHMLHRIEPEHWGRWFETQEPSSWEPPPAADAGGAA